MPNKRHSQFGIKKFELCESVTGYVLHVELYAGKDFPIHRVMGEAHGVMGQAHGVMGEAHGVMGQAHGVMGQAHGVMRQAHGVIGQAHGVVMGLICLCNMLNKCYLLFMDNFYVTLPTFKSTKIASPSCVTISDEIRDLLRSV